MSENDKQTSGDQQRQITPSSPQESESSGKVPENQPQALLKPEENLPKGIIREARDRPDDTITLVRQEDMNNEDTSKDES